MALRIRTSKFRHVYGAQCRREQTFENIRITRNTHDSNFCSVNPRFLAIVTESSGGGSFAVLDVNRPGRVDINCPRVCGHAGAVLDVKWSPFNDCVIASGSDDSTVKIWTVPDNGLMGTLTDWSADLHGHTRRVGYVEWHPTAANVLTSVGFDFKVMIWNVEQAEPITSIGCHRDTIYSVSWGRDGALIATTCKDKKVRVVDPRTAQVAMETSGHQSTKASKVVFVSDNQVFTTGFSHNSDRQYALWDIRKPGEALTKNDIDCSSGILLPYYDPDTKVVYLAGKGDGNIRYFEISPEDNGVHFLNSYLSSSPQRGLGMMPKRGIDPFKNEVARFYKLHASKNLVEPISMIVPRKAEGFQPDVFPPTASKIPSLSADEWTSGINRGPILVDLETGAIMDKPKSSMSPAVQPQMGNLRQQPEITTYKAVNKAPPTSFVNPTPAPSSYRGQSATYNPAHSAFSANQAPFSKQAPPTTLRTSPEGHAQTVTKSPSMSHRAANAGPGGVVNGRERGWQEPASIKNIKRLSMHRDDDSESDISTPSSQAISPASSVSSVHGQNRASRSPGSPLSLVSPPPPSPSSVQHVNGFPAESSGGDHHTAYMATATAAPFTAVGETFSTSQSPHLSRQSRFGRSSGLPRYNTVAGSSNAEHVSAVKMVIGPPTTTSHANIHGSAFKPSSISQPSMETATARPFPTPQCPQRPSSPAALGHGSALPRYNTIADTSNAEHVSAIQRALGPFTAPKQTDVWQPSPMAPSPTSVPTPAPATTATPSAYSMPQPSRYSYPPAHGHVSALPRYGDSNVEQAGAMRHTPSSPAAASQADVMQPRPSYGATAPTTTPAPTPAAHAKSPSPSFTKPPSPKPYRKVPFGHSGRSGNGTSLPPYNAPADRSNVEPVPAVQKFVDSARASTEADMKPSYMTPWATSSHTPTTFTTPQSPQFGRKAPQGHGSAIPQYSPISDSGNIEPISVVDKDFGPPQHDVKPSYMAPWATSSSTPTTFTTPESPKFGRKAPQGHVTGIPRYGTMSDASNIEPISAVDKDFGRAQSDIVKPSDRTPMTTRIAATPVATPFKTPQSPQFGRKAPYGQSPASPMTTTVSATPAAAPFKTPQSPQFGRKAPYGQTPASPTTTAVSATPAAAPFKTPQSPQFGRKAPYGQSPASPRYDARPGTTYVEHVSAMNKVAAPPEPAPKPAPPKTAPKPNITKPSYGAPAASPATAATSTGAPSTFTTPQSPKPYRKFPWEKNFQASSTSQPDIMKPSYVTQPASSGNVPTSTGAPSTLTTPQSPKPFRKVAFGPGTGTGLPRYQTISDSTNVEAVSGIQKVSSPFGTTPHADIAKPSGIAPSVAAKPASSFATPQSPQPNQKTPFGRGSGLPRYNTIADTSGTEHVGAIQRALGPFMGPSQTDTWKPSAPSAPATTTIASSFTTPQSPQSARKGRYGSGSAQTRYHTVAGTSDADHVTAVETVLRPSSISSEADIKKPSYGYKAPVVVPTAATTTAPVAKPFVPKPQSPQPARKSQFGGGSALARYQEAVANNDGGGASAGPLKPRPSSVGSESDIMKPSYSKAPVAVPTTAAAPKTFTTPQSPQLARRGRFGAGPALTRYHTVAGTSDGDSIGAVQIAPRPSSISSEADLKYSAYGAPTSTPIATTTTATTTPLAYSLTTPPQSPRLARKGPYGRPALPRYNTITDGTNVESTSTGRTDVPTPSTTTQADAIHVRKVWSPPVTAVASPSPVSPSPQLGVTAPSTDPELKKAYFRQLEEIRSLQEQLQLKDRRIKQLEKEVSQLRERDAGLGPGESNC